MMPDPFVNWKPTVEENPDFTCHLCGSNKILYREIDEVYADYKYMCQSCGKIWVVEGMDA